MVGLAGEPIPVDQQYRQFITDKTSFLKQVPSQVLRNGAVKFRQGYSRFFQKLGGRPKIKKKTGRQSVWLTSELFQLSPQIDERTGAVASYQLHIGTKKFPVGIIPYVAHRSHAGPSSIHIAVEGGHWWLSFAAEDPTVTIPGRDADAATERIAEDLRHLSVDQLGAVPKGQPSFRATSGVVMMRRKKPPSRSSLEGGLLEEVMGDTHEPPFGSHFLQPPQ